MNEYLLRIFYVLSFVDSFLFFSPPFFVKILPTGFLCLIRPHPRFGKLVLYFAG